MKVFLKKYLSILILFIIAFLILSILIQNSKIKSLESRIDTINNSFQKIVLKDSLEMENIKLNKFKEDVYIKQLDRDTSFILWFVAIVFGLFGLISFSSFSKRVEMIETALNKKYKKHIKEISIIKGDIYELKADLNSDSASLNNNEAQNFFNEKNFDLYVFYELLSAYKQTKAYIYHTDKNEELSEGILNSIITNISALHIRIKDLEIKPKIDEKTFNQLVDGIRNLNNLEINEFLSKIHTLVEYKE